MTISNDDTYYYYTKDENNIIPYDSTRIDTKDNRRDYKCRVKMVSYRDGLGIISYVVLDDYFFETHIAKEDYFRELSIDSYNKIILMNSVNPINSSKELNMLVKELTK